MVLRFGTWEKMVSLWDITISGTTIHTGELVAKLSNHRFKYLDFATRHSSPTPAYFQQVGKRVAGIALSPGQIRKTCQHIGEFFQPFNNGYNRRRFDHGILHDYHHGCRTVYIRFSCVWRDRLFNIGCVGIMVGCHNLASEEIRKRYEKS